MLISIENKIHNFLIASEYTTGASFRITCDQQRLVCVLGFSETKSPPVLVLVLQIRVD